MQRKKVVTRFGMLKMKKEDEFHFVKSSEWNKNKYSSSKAGVGNY